MFIVWLCGSMSWNGVCVACYATCRSDIFVYFNVNFNMFFKLIKVHLLARKIYMHQNACCNNEKICNKISEGEVHNALSTCIKIHLK